jgi:peptidyl-prolyl cis-trans isomerase C
MSMNASFRRALPALIAAMSIAASGAAHAQNAAIVNGKAIPKSRLDEFVAALAQQGPSGHARAAHRRPRRADRTRDIQQEAEKSAACRANPDVQRQLDQTARTS